MSTENRRGFLKTLLGGGAVTAVGTVTGAAPAPVPPKPIVVVREKIVKEIAPFPQNITGDEMAMWLAITQKRREEKWVERRRIAAGGSPWRDRSST